VFRSTGIEFVAFGFGVHEPTYGPNQRGRQDASQDLRPLIRRVKPMSEAAVYRELRKKKANDPKCKNQEAPPSPNKNHIITTEVLSIRQRLGCEYTSDKLLFLPNELIVGNIMPTVYVPKDQIVRGTLPDVCLICGNTAVVRRFPKLGTISAQWMLESPIHLMISFWFSVIYPDQPREQRLAGMPFCERHQSYWSRRGWSLTLGLLLSLGVFFTGAALTPEAQKGPGRVKMEREMHWMSNV
jgi:hypothetical protein